MSGKNKSRKVLKFLVLIVVLSLVLWLLPLGSLFATPDGDEVKTSLEVTKTASGSISGSVTYLWDIEKSVNETNLSLEVGESATSNYTIVVTNVGTESSSSSANVSGTITIENDPNYEEDEDKTAYIRYVDDAIEYKIPGQTGLMEGGFFELQKTRLRDYFEIVTGGTETISYSIDFTPPDGATAFRNVVYVMLNNHPASGGRIEQREYVTRESFILSDSGLEEIDEQITVEDTLGGTLGTASISEIGVGGSKTFNYVNPVGPYLSPGNYQIDNTATFTTNDTPTQGSDSETVFIEVTEEAETTYKVIIHKTSDVVDTFNFSLNTGDSISITVADDGTGTITGQSEFTGLLEGDYTVTETNSANYDTWVSLSPNPELDNNNIGKTINFNIPADAKDNIVYVYFHNDPIETPSGNGGTTTVVTVAVVTEEVVEEEVEVLGIEEEVVEEEAVVEVLGIEELPYTGFNFIFSLAGILLIMAGGILAATIFLPRKKGEIS